MQLWDHSIEILSFDNALAQTKLNKLSEEGWEAISTLPCHPCHTSGYYNMLFKRPHATGSTDRLAALDQRDRAMLLLDRMSLHLQKNPEATGKTIMGVIYHDWYMLGQEVLRQPNG